MENHVASKIHLDFDDVEQLDVVRRLVEFAEYESTDSLDEAICTLGDGRAVGNPYQYVAIDAPESRAEFHLSSPFSITQLAAAVALCAGHQSEAELVASALRFVGESEHATETRGQISKAAARDVTVLITGESGTGKEVVARALHDGSLRATGPFIPINCGAIPGELLESELFGHEKGAFTGAIAQKVGRFELAHGGTLFLDEIGDMPFAMQVKLLRAIEEKCFERIGSVKSRVSDVRIIAATNQNLEEKIVEGTFRDDLFYRLNVFPIEITPLRERTEDLPQLIAVLMEKIRAEQGISVRLSMEALAILGTYPWPGNVRELSNLLQRLAIQYPNEIIRSVDLPKKYTEESKAVGIAADEEGDIRLPVNGIDLKDYLTRLEKSLIEQALEDTNAVVARAADRLHIRRTTLVEKMRKHGLGRSLESIQ